MEIRYLLALHLSRSHPHLSRRDCFNDEHLNNLYTKISEMCGSIRNEYRSYCTDRAKCNDLRDLHNALEELFHDDVVHIGRIAAAFVLASMFYEECESTYALYEINTLIERKLQQKGVEKWINHEQNARGGVRKYIAPMVAALIQHFTNSFFTI